MSESIRTGIATILWASAWADHVEECACQSLSGCEITDVMPVIPDEAWNLADTLISAVEAKHGCSVDELYRLALIEDKIDGIDAPARRSGEQRFGECIAWEAMGAGVSWADDHATAALSKYVHIYNHDLCELAIEQCGCMNLEVQVCSRDEWVDEDGNTYSEGTFPARQQSVMLDVYALNERHAEAWANRHQGALGGTWEVDGTLVYDLTFDYPDLVKDLRAEGYELDLSEYEECEPTEEFGAIVEVQS